MTDEEKAEEYADKLLCDEKCSFLIDKEKVKKYILKVYLDALDCCKKSYEKGLAEGRKIALKELVERVEKDQAERQVQTINVIELKAIIKEMGVDL